VNPARDRGIRAEREACAVLARALDLDIRRRANEGVREDIGDLIGVPDTTIQVSAVPDNPTKIAERAHSKLVDVELQRQRAGTTHAVVLLRIDGGHWRALCATNHLYALTGAVEANVVADPCARPGLVLRWAPLFACRTWTHVPLTGKYVASLDGWCRSWRTRPTPQLQ